MNESSEDLENLICLVGPAVNTKNTDFIKCYQCEVTLGNYTEIPCNWEFVLQRDVIVEGFKAVNIVNNTPRVCET